MTDQDHYGSIEWLIGSKGARFRLIHLTLATTSQICLVKAHPTPLQLSKALIAFNCAPKFAKGIRNP
jgi:hypothetical protein